MFLVTGVLIEPNPVGVGDEITIEVEVQEFFKNAKRYRGKYPYRYAGIQEREVKESEKISI